MTAPQLSLGATLARQDGAITVAQARAAGISVQQQRTMVRNGWTRPHRGVLVQPSPRDPFRASLRAALLACPQGVACQGTAARLHRLSGIPLWTTAELPSLLLPPELKRAQRAGLRTHFGLQPGQAVLAWGFPATTLSRTIADLLLQLPFDDVICLLDSALNAGWLPELATLTGRQRERCRHALALADGRAESALETIIRLLLVRAGLPPEALQLRLEDVNGVCYARLDLAWPSRRLAVEADGREHHDKPDALYKDRRRQNLVTLAGWTVLRFTWHDVLRNPHWVVQQVRTGLAGLAS